MENVRIATPEMGLLLDVTAFYDAHLRAIQEADFPRMESRRDYLTYGGDLTPPVHISDDIWETTLYSSYCEMKKPIKVKFKTMRIEDFIKDALDLNTNIYQITKPANSLYRFGSGSGTGSAYLIVPKGYAFDSDIIFSNIKIPVDYYTYDAATDIVNVDCPYVKGIIRVNQI